MSRIAVRSIGMASMTLECPAVGDGMSAGGFQAAIHPSTNPGEIRPLERAEATIRERLDFGRARRSDRLTRPRRQVPSERKSSNVHAC